MRAVCITKPGDVEVLRVMDRTVREAGSGEVRISVRAAAVNPSDLVIREHGGEHPAPWIPGWEAAGVIESIGAGVNGLAVDDEVIVVVAPRRAEGGAQAELIVAPAASVVPIPNGATPAEAATLPMNGLTALLGLEMLALEEGQTLAVSGGAGLLASYVIPIAKLRGLRVIADARLQDQQLVSGFGADLVLSRGDGFPEAVREASGGGADGFFDTATLGRAAFPAIRDGGGIAVVRGWSDGEPERGIEVHPVFVREVLDRTDWLQDLRRLASSGSLRLRVAAEYPPEDVAEAHRVMGAGGLRGRGVIVFT